MNDKFFELPENKQMRIIDAALEVFSQNDYKHASTEDMAVKAGISKGLLFYYFHNKKELYLYVYKYTEGYLKNKILNTHFEDFTDFFELLEYCTQCKAEVLERNPYMLDFFIRTLFSQKEEISEKMNEKVNVGVEEAYTKYLKNIDTTKFKEGVDIMQIVKMFTWMAEGYLHEKQRSNTPLVLGDLMSEYRSWANMFKRVIYKEEYIK